MYVKINGTNYTKLASLSLNTETSLATDAIPISQMQADIITDDDIQIGQWAGLWNGRHSSETSSDILAQLWITAAYRINKDTVRIIAESEIVRLSKEKLPAAMWTNKTVRMAVSELFPWRAYSEITGMVDGTLRNLQVSGYCPEQTPRERLQLLCMRIGAYVDNWGNDYRATYIRPIDTTASLIPLNHTFYRPEIKHKDWVTKITFRGHNYVQGEPDPADDYVKVGNDTYIDNWFDYEFANADAPSGASVNEVRVEDMTLNYITNVEKYLKDYYFAPVTVEMDIINCHADAWYYWPGAKVYFYTDEQTLMSGYIEKCDFRFGLLARSRLSIVMVQPVTTTYTITINNQYNGNTVASKAIVVPDNAYYSYVNPTFYRVEEGKLAKYTPQYTGWRSIKTDGADLTQNEAYNRTLLPLT